MEPNFIQVSTPFQLASKKTILSPTPRGDLIVPKVTPVPLTAAGSGIGMDVIQAYGMQRDAFRVL